MILGTEQLLHLVKTKNLVENLSERELKNPEGAGFDFRIGEIYRIKGTALIGVEDRKTPDIELVAKFQDGIKSKHVIKPGEFYLGKTIEKLNTPEDITINFKPRTTTFRSGLTIRSGNVAPGYKGEIVFAIKNDGPCDVELEMGSRVIHAQFHLVEGKANLYRGQWQGGRVTTKNLEKQI